MRKATNTKKTATKSAKNVKKTAVKPTTKKTATKKPIEKKTAKKSTKTVVKKDARKETNKEYENRKNFIKSYGFESVSDFATALNDDIANTTKVLQGKQKPNIEKMIKYAITLNSGLGEIINLFYPELMKEYKKKHNKNRK
jgi:oligoribonuclease (3'-5' exoribonuclease)